MKILIYIIPLFLIGCATQTPIINPIKVEAPSEIMKDCEEFIKPKNNSFSDFAQALIDNKKVYELCKNQNKAKKDFILNN